jgi:putative transposase
MDIAYIPTARGFVYLAAAIDWFGRGVLWRQSITAEGEFLIAALEEAPACHGRPEIFNMDQQSIHQGHKVVSWNGAGSGFLVWI